MLNTDFRYSIAGRFVRFIQKTNPGLPAWEVALGLDVKPWFKYRWAEGLREFKRELHQKLFLVSKRLMRFRNKYCRLANGNDRYNPKWVGRRYLEGLSIYLHVKAPGVKPVWT